MPIRFQSKDIGDPMVVAAFNSCFDSEKWQALPERVRDRLKVLLDHHRLKFVCFSDELGLGLRVYNEGTDWQWESDEATGQLTSEVDTSGHWVRCPKELWEQFNVQPPAPKYMIRKPDGTQFLQEEDANYDTADWGTFRSSGLRFDSREEAQGAIDRNRALKDCVIVFEILPEKFASEDNS
jgi:hypothetical protein